MSSLYHNHYPPCTLHSELFHTPTNLYSLSITAIPFVHSHNAISHTLSSAYRPLSFSFFYLFRTHLVLQGPTQATDSWNPVLYLHKSICSFLWAPLSLYFILEFPTSSNHCCQYSPPILMCELLKDRTTPKVDQTWVILNYCCLNESMWRASLFTLE